jgi:lysophospholipase L1-like esterase
MGPRHVLTLAAGLLACALSPSLASADPVCTAPADILRLAQPLSRTAARLAKHEPLTIVAVGSSSTFGAGASSPAASYPSRLAVELKTIFPKETINVINRGVNGEEVTDMLRRFADSVLKEKPDLVLWQVGTNSVLRDKPLGPHSPLLLDGIRRLKAAGADVVLIDPQYVPRVIAKADAEGMVRLIATTAKQGDVDLIQRFAMMRWWHDHEHMDFAEFASPDNLHMNDWGYACLAKQISAAIVEAATRNVTSASASASVRPVMPISVTP